MTNVIRNTILSSQYNKLVEWKVHVFFCFCVIRNTWKKVPANLSSWEKLWKLDAAKINTFTVSIRGLQKKISWCICAPVDHYTPTYFSQIFKEKFSTNKIWKSVGCSSGKVRTQIQRVTDLGPPLIWTPELYSIFNLLWVIKDIDLS